MINSGTGKEEIVYDDGVIVDTFTAFEFEGFKNSQPINCDSEMLLNYLIFLEWDTTVKSYRQPEMSLGVEYRGANYEAEIALWVDYRNGETEMVHFLDQKWTALINENPMLYARFELLCRDSNLRYLPVSTVEINCEPLLSNLKLIWRNARYSLQMTHVMLVNNFLAREKQPTLGQLCELFSNAEFPVELVYTLIFHKLILADILYLPLTDETTVLAGHVYPAPDIIPPVLVLERLEKSLSVMQRVN